MRKITKYMLNDHLPERLLFAFLFGCLVMAFVYTTKDIYHRFFDTTEYISIDSPVSVDKAYYKPCDAVKISAGLESRIDVEAAVLTELLLVKENNNDYERVDGSQVIQAFPFRKADHHVASTTLKLPCDLLEGQYYWKGNVTYSVQGYEHTESFLSQIFHVTQSGLSPVGQDLQDQIDELK